MSVLDDDEIDRALREASGNSLRNVFATRPKSKSGEAAPVPSRRKVRAKERNSPQGSEEKAGVPTQVSILKKKPGHRNRKLHKLLAWGGQLSSSSSSSSSSTSEAPAPEPERWRLEKRSTEGPGRLGDGEEHGDLPRRALHEEGLQGVRQPGEDARRAPDVPRRKSHQAAAPKEQETSGSREAPAEAGEVLADAPPRKSQMHSPHAAQGGRTLVPQVPERRKSSSHSIMAEDWLADRSGVAQDLAQIPAPRRSLDGLGTSSLAFSSAGDEPQVLVDNGMHSSVKSPPSAPRGMGGIRHIESDFVIVTAPRGLAGDSNNGAPHERASRQIVSVSAWSSLLNQGRSLLEMLTPRADSPPATKRRHPDNKIQTPPRRDMSVPHTLSSVPHTLSSVPHTLSSVPQTLSSVPHTLSSVPHTLSSVPHTPDGERHAHSPWAAEEASGRTPIRGAVALRASLMSASEGRQADEDAAQQLGQSPPAVGKKSPPRSVLQDVGGSIARRESSEWRPTEDGTKRQRLSDESETLETHNLALTDHTEKGNRQPPSRAMPSRESMEIRQHATPPKPILQAPGSRPSPSPKQVSSAGPSLSSPAIAPSPAVIARTQSENPPATMPRLSKIQNSGSTRQSNQRPEDQGQKASPAPQRRALQEDLVSPLPQGQSPANKQKSASIFAYPFFSPSPSKKKSASMSQAKSPGRGQDASASSLILSYSNFHLQEGSEVSF